MYVRNCWYMAAWSTQVPAGILYNCKILEQPVVLFRDERGSIAALDDACPHRLAPLSLGQLECGTVRCMYHGMRFAADGRCLEVPGGTKPPAELTVHTYPVTERSGWIWVWMGDPTLANEARIPRMIGLDDPAWTLAHDHIDYDADYQLINDNLTDFSHVSYLHRGSFAESEEWATKRGKVTRLPFGINFQRWVDTADNAYGAQWGVSAADQWTNYDYTIPGVLSMVSTVYPDGTAARSAGKPPPDNIKPIYETYTAQAVTPIDPRRTRYFFSSGTRSGEGSAARVEALMAVGRLAFEEDRIMIEAQQRNIDGRAGQRMMPFTPGDIGPVLMRRVIASLVAKEAEANAPSRTTSGATEMTVLESREDQADA